MNYLNKYFDFFGKRVKKLVKKPIDEICTVRTYHSTEEELPISVTRPGNYCYWDNISKKILFSHDRKSGFDGFFFTLGDGFKNHLKFHDKWSIKTVKLPILFNDIIEIIEKIDSNLQIYSGQLGYNSRNLYDKSRKGTYHNLAEFFFNFSIMDDYADKIPSDIFNEYKNEISKRLKSKRDEYLSLFDIDENSNFYKILNMENNTTDNTTHGKISLSIGIDFSVIYCDMPKGHDIYCNAFHTNN
jgi:hypothetical protein